MVDIVTSGAASLEKPDDLGKDDAAKVAYWLMQDKLAEKEEKNWRTRGRRIIKRYRAERGEIENSTSQFNVLWSNVQTLKPALYARSPKPDVERRYKDQDDVGRLAATLLERSLTYSMDAYDFDDVMKPAIEDRLLPGRGVARILYIPHYGEPIVLPGEEATEGGSDGEIVANEGDEGAADKPPAEPADAPREVVFEEVRAKYVHWEDYREGPARQWDEVPWVRYKSYMTRDELVARFGKKKGNAVNLDYAPKPSGNDDKADPVLDLLKKAVVWEIWVKSTKKAIWIAPGTPDLLLDEQDDPLRLPEFFPNPNPLLSTTTTDKRIPVPDYKQYEDQAREMDVLTERISKLTRALKVAGVYAASEKAVLQQLIDEGTENRLIPVEDWMALTDKGGLQGMILWLPIETIAKVLMSLYDARDKAKAVLYEVTGLADIMRGASDPRETATAVRTKGVFGTLRLAESQKDVANFARALVRMKAAIIGEHFSPQTISMITGYPQLDPVPPAPEPQPVPPAPQVPQMVVNPQTGQPVPNPALQQYQQAVQHIMAANHEAQQKYQATVAPIIAGNQKKQQEFEAAVALIKKDALHDFRIDIEVDSTVAIDEDAEKQARVEFLEQMVPMLEKVMPIAQGSPALATLAKEMVLFAARSFKAGRQLEEPLENAFDAIAQMPPKPPGGKSAPEMQLEQEKLQGEQASEKAKLQFEQQKIVAEQSFEREKMQMEAEAEQARAQADIQIAQAKAEQDFQLEQLRIQQEGANQMAIAKLEAETKVLCAKITAKSSVEVASRSGNAMAKPGDGSDFDPDPINPGPDLTQALAAAVSGFTEAIGHMKAIVAHQQAPKVIVRDQNGRPVGIQTALDQGMVNGPTI